jgi:hypothetical protein
MTDMGTGSRTGPPPAGASADVPYQRTAEPRRTAWVGWIYFAGAMAVMVGIFQAIAGLVALLDDGYYLVTRNGLAVHMTYNEWGWIHLIGGVLLIAVGVGMVIGQTWARFAAVGIAVLSAIANFLFLAAYPVWSTIMIALSVLVIYAVTQHGREVRY